MAVSNRICWSSMARGLLAGVVLAGAGIAAGRAGADIIKKEDLLRGLTMTQTQCTAIAQALWLNVYGQDFCVRYYLSTAGGEGSRPVIFLNGDSNGPVDVTRDNRTGHTTLSWHDPSRAVDENTDDYPVFADQFSKMAKTTAIYIGRIGDSGTSGSHLARKTQLELGLMSAALDALKQRYHFTGFHLSGHSGGAKIAFGLAGTRNDIGCLVSGSGQLILESPASQAGDPGKTFFEINVRAVAQNKAVRKMLVGDPDDQQVPERTQQYPMLDKLIANGGRGEMYFAQSTDANHHGTLEHIELVMAGCVLGKTEKDIVFAIAALNRRNTQINKRKEDEAAAKAARLAQQPAH